MNDHLFFKANLPYSSDTCQDLSICLSSEALRRALRSFASTELAVFFGWPFAGRAWGWFSWRKHQNGCCSRIQSGRDKIGSMAQLINPATLLLLSSPPKGNCRQGLPLTPTYRWPNLLWTSRKFISSAASYSNIFRKFPCFWGKRLQVLLLLLPLGPLP